MASCWHADTDERPTFEAIGEYFLKILESDRYSTILPILDPRYTRVVLRE